MAIQLGPGAKPGQGLRKRSGSIFDKQIGIPVAVLIYIKIHLNCVKSSPGDDLIDWNLHVSVRSYVHKKFLRFLSTLACGYM